MKSSHTIRLMAGLLAASAMLMGPGHAQTSETAATAELLDDGAVQITGIDQPGQDAAIPESCAEQTGVAALVACTAQAFLDTLSDDQQAQVVLGLTEENSTAWSNLPCGADCRVGILMSDLDDTQRQAAMAVLMAASSDSPGDGFDEITQIMMADDILTASQASGGGAPGGEPPEGMEMPADDAMAPPDGMGGGGPALSYSSGTYLIAFLGEPGTADPWQLQFGGHHLAVLRTFSGGSEVSATPNFIGVEPKVWIKDGVTYAPLDDDRDAMVDMLASLSDEQLEAARLEASFSDVLLGPGKDGQFPETKLGLAVSQLDDAQKEQVLAAIRERVGDTTTETTEAIMAQYAEQLDETYIGYSGDTSLTGHGDYVRIDGPGVWIEFVCQNGVVFGDQIHYHTIWRDHEADYGAVYDFAGSGA